MGPANSSSEEPLTLNLAFLSSLHTPTPAGAEATMKRYPCVEETVFKSYPMENDSRAEFLEKSPVLSGDKCTSLGGRRQVTMIGFARSQELPTPGNPHLGEADIRNLHWRYVLERTRD